MRKLSTLLLALFALLPLPAAAQNFIPVTGSHVGDFGGNLLANGTVCFIATDNHDAPLQGVNVGGSTQAFNSIQGVCGTISNGVITGPVSGTGTFQVANPAVSTPSGFLYRITITDTDAGSVVSTYKLVVVPSTSFDFDDFISNSTAYTCVGCSMYQPLNPANNLSDVANAATALQNLHGLSTTSTSAQTIAGPINAPVINGIVKADQEPGATADVKIAACIAAVGSRGICDGRGFGATTQSMAATVTIPSNVTLMLSSATKFQAATASQNLFIIEPDAVLEGLIFDCGNQPTYSGIVIQNDTASSYFPNTGSQIGMAGVYNSGTSSNCESVNTGTFIQLSSSSNNQPVYAFGGAHVYPNGLHDGLHYITSVNGYINGTHWVDYKSTQSVDCIHFTTNAGTGSPNTSQISGNTFSDYSCEATGGGTNTPAQAILYDGSTTNTSANSNNFYGDIWDYTTAINQSLSVDGGNFYEGIVQGTVSDATGGSYALIQSGYSFQAPTFYIGSLSGNQLNVDGSNNVYLVTGSGKTLYLGNGSNSRITSTLAVFPALNVGGSATLGGSIQIPSLSDLWVNGATQTLGLGSDDGTNLYAHTAASGSFYLNNAHNAAVASNGNIVATAINAPPLNGGVVTLASGTATVSTSATCSASGTCVYRFTRCAVNSSTATGDLSLGTVTVGTSFVINSLSSTATVVTGDLSTVCWSIN